MTREDTARAVANTCPYDKYFPSNADWVTTYRNRFVVNDRLTTRDHEIWINRLIAEQDKCLSNTVRQIEQAASVPEATRKALLIAVMERQKQAPEGIRAMFVAAGFKPSSAPPGPRYGYCIIHDDFGPEFRDIDHYYISRVFIDRDPENEIADTGKSSDPNKSSPKSAAGQKTLDALSGWAAQQYKRAASRDAFCQFFLSAQDAADARPKDETTSDPFNFQVALP